MITATAATTATKSTPRHVGKFLSIIASFYWPINQLRRATFQSQLSADSENFKHG